MAYHHSLSQIEQLAATISESVARLKKVLSSHGLPLPSFDENAHFQLPEATIADQDAIVDATAELHDLLLDPMTLIREYGGHNNSICFQAISRFGIAEMVPLGSQVTFKDIAKQTGLSEDITCRLLRYAMTMRVFCEPEQGMVSHTAASRMLITPSICDWLRVGTEELWPASVKTLDALQKWPSSSDPRETGFSLANNTDKSLYEVLQHDPKRASQFARAMAAYTQSPGFSISHISDNYGWSTIGNAQIVDVGGAQGHVAMKLASQFPNLSFIVQDMSEVIKGAESLLSQDIHDRVQFMAHDLFAEQTVQADMFIFRWVLHNWSDYHCILILRAQIPALKPGAIIMIQDGYLPERGTSALWREKYKRSDDLSMASMFNSKERTASEWKDLLVSADPRFVMRSVVHPNGSALGIIEVVWEPQDEE
ncbi:O-methyltransferase-domain-containing protein [Xylaria sp. FL1042]|nr:O-methyltransferase-domain-containing protein [Xylaria sp. FL1042]